MKTKKSKTSGKQKALSLVFALSFVLGFMSVWATAQYYNDIAETSLFITDSDTTFGHYPYSTNYIYASLTNWTTKEIGSKTPFVNSTEYDPIYLGNDTWGFSVNGCGVGDYSYYAVNTHIEMPNLAEWVVSRVELNLTAMSSLYPSSMEVFFYHFDSPYNVDDGGGIIDSTQFTSIYYTNDDIDTYRNLSIDIPLDKGLRISTYSQNKDSNHLLIIYKIDSAITTGLESFSNTFKVEIFGNLQSTNSLSTMITYGLIGATIINVAVIIFMTDRFDVGGYVKDLPKRRG